MEGCLADFSRTSSKTVERPHRNLPSLRGEGVHGGVGSLRARAVPGLQGFSGKAKSELPLLPATCHVCHRRPLLQLSAECDCCAAWICFRRCWFKLPLFLNDMSARTQFGFAVRRATYNPRRTKSATLCFFSSPYGKRSPGVLAGVWFPHHDFT